MSPSVAIERLRESPRRRRGRIAGNDPIGTSGVPLEMPSIVSRNANGLTYTMSKALPLEGPRGERLSLTASTAAQENPETRHKRPRAMTVCPEHYALMSGLGRRTAQRQRLVR